MSARHKQSWLYSYVTSALLPIRDIGQLITKPRRCSVVAWRSAAVAVCHLAALLPSACRSCG